MKHHVVHVRIAIHLVADPTQQQAPLDLDKLLRLSQAPPRKEVLQGVISLKPADIVEHVDLAAFLDREPYDFPSHLRLEDHLEHEERRKGRDGKAESKLQKTVHRRW
jgi:hypothetical protein